VIAKRALPLVLARSIVVLTGVGLQIFLARWLAPDLFGLWGIVMALLILIEYSLLGAFAASAAKLVSENRGSAGSVARKIMTFQMFLACGIATALFLSAPMLASLLGDHRLTFYVRLGVLDIPLTAVVITYGGVLSGLMHFTKRAWVVIGYSLAKILAVFILMLAGFSLTGALVGKLCASALAALHARWLCGHQPSTEEVRTGRIAEFSLPILALSLSVAVLGSMGLFCLKAMDSEPMADGWYTAIQNVTKAPGMVFMGVTGALFPSFSAAIASGDITQGMNPVAQSVRLLFLLLLPTAVVLCGTAEELIVLVYGQPYLPAALPLKILTGGMICLAFARVMLTAINADNRPGLSLRIVLVQLPVAFFLYLALIPRYSIAGAAMTVAISALIGALLGWYCLGKRYSGLFPSKSFLRILFASSVIFLGVQAFSLSGILLLPFYGMLALAYLGLLWMLNEVTPEEKVWIKSMGTSAHVACLAIGKKFRWRIP